MTILPTQTGSLSSALQAASPMLLGLSQGIRSGNTGAGLQQGLAGMMALQERNKAKQAEETLNKQLDGMNIPQSQRAVLATMPLQMKQQYLMRIFDQQSRGGGGGGGGGAPKAPQANPYAAYGAPSGQPKASVASMPMGSGIPLSFGDTVPEKGTLAQGMSIGEPIRTPENPAPKLSFPAPKPPTEEEQRAKVQSRIEKIDQRIVSLAQNPALATTTDGRRMIASLQDARENLAARIAPGEEDQRARKIKEYQDIYGFSAQDATALADGIIAVSRDPITGEATLVDKRTMLGQADAPAEEQPPTQPAAGAQPELSFGPQYANAPDSFGGEGTFKRAANTLGGLVNTVPYPDVQSTQADFAVLGEKLINDIASGYNRQPPSWLLRNIEELTPKAGRPFQGTGDAQAKLRSIGRDLQGELELTERNLSRPLRPAEKQEMQARAASLRAALNRVGTALQSFQSQGVRPDVAERLRAYE